MLDAIPLMNTDNTISAGFLRNRFGEGYLPDVNSRVFDDAPSSDVFERRLTIDFTADDTLFVVVGTDSGLLHSYLRDVSLGKGSRRLLIESDELHARIGARAAPDTEAATLCRFSDWEETLREWEIGHYLHGGRVQLVESLGCLHDRSGAYMTMMGRIRARLTELECEQEVAVSYQSFMRTQLRNACANRVPAHSLIGIGAGCTAVVLGAGPSLDESMDWVIANRDSVFLIAVSRLCGKLQGLDLRPDVVIAVDPYSNLYDLSKEGLLWEDVPLVHSYHVSPELLHQWRGPCLYLGDLHPWHVSGETGTNIGSHGPTVSHSAAWLAHCWGFERILLCGVGMCYALGGNSHAKGSVENMAGALPSQWDASVRTYSGRLAGTDKLFQLGTSRLDNIGRLANQHGPRLFNTSSDAARVDSIPLIDLATIELSGSRPALSLPSSSASPVEHLERVRDEHTDAIRRFGKIARGSAEAIGLLEAMESATDEGAYHRSRRRLDRLEATLEKEHGPWYDAIKQFGSRELLASVKPSGFDDENGQSQEWGRRYYKTVRNVAKTFDELLRDSLERIAMRFAEFDEEPDIDTLLDYWSRDDTRGRVLALRSRSEPGTAATHRVDREARTFLATLHDKDTRHAALIRDRQMNPDNLLRNLGFLFREKMSGDLTLLADNLSSLEPPHDLFAHHAAGLHAELRGEVGTALEAYRRVIDRFGELLENGEEIPERFDSLLEEALQRITGCHLGTGDGESAAESLALLSQLSSFYVPQYAHLLHLLNRHAEALEMLELRLQASPEDWRALLQIADIYTALGLATEAETVRRLADETRECGNRLDRAA